MAAMTRKTTGHEPKLRIKPPEIGASIGAAPLTSASRANALRQLLAHIHVPGRCPCDDDPRCACKPLDEAEQHEHPYVGGEGT